MRFGPSPGLQIWQAPHSGRGRTSHGQGHDAPTTVSNIGVAIFVADRDAALAFFTEKLGFEGPRRNALR
jgi:hypothetical protein